MIPINSIEKNFMKLALSEAERASEEGEIPVGAVIVDANSNVLSSTHNTQLRDDDPTSHAELLAIRKALGVIDGRYLEGCTLFVTLEPCVMCAGAIAHSRIPRVIIGAWDEKTGAAGSLYDVLRDARLPHPQIEVIGGVFESESAQLLQNFFLKRRVKNSI
ncbi:MAG TPA: tRNA adenosine(34) deaminase TadA [Microbacteriaceae bacterium]|nr:tRNA adenosine(34) deaminase TadA [Microbacteriaceae bacterium]